MKTENILFMCAGAIFVLALTLHFTNAQEPTPDNLQRFASGEDLLKAFEESKNRGWLGDMDLANFGKTMVMEASAPMGADSSDRAYSTTTIQVAGVDEADIIKTDGDYIYTLAKNKLYIIKAYPEADAKIISEIELDQFSPQELFIHQDRLLLFGSSNYNGRTTGEPVEMYYPRYMNMVSAKLFDIEDKENPELLRTVELEGHYLTSRKIGANIYFVVNSYPHFRDNLDPEEIIPLYKDSENNNKAEPIAKPTEIGYLEPIQAENFITIASISMTDQDKPLTTETIVGSGQNVYTSLNHLYIAQTSWPQFELGELVEGFPEKTTISKFRLDHGEIEFISAGEVKGHILNQFSMDEHDGNFRIATTAGQVWDRDRLSSNNIYILDENMNTIGKLEDLAPGEKIYSVRFMGNRGYVVTFKKVDPLFVIDLSTPNDPEVLGKLKIPGYSDYLHPYDENHIIGIGKDTLEAEEDLKDRRNLDFAWYQGVKMALFDVSDVENPKELHKIVIGDRGTDSPALHDHKAFLFDRERNFLVLPITLAEIQGERNRDNQYGDYTFQGAYVFNLNKADGFNLRGRITHYDNDEVFQKSGYYFRGDSAIKRSLFIEDILYTLSDNRLQLNNLDNLDKIKAIEFGEN